MATATVKALEARRVVQLSYVFDDIDQWLRETNIDIKGDNYGFPYIFPQDFQGFGFPRIIPAHPYWKGIARYRKHIALHAAGQPIETDERGHWLTDDRGEPLPGEHWKPLYPDCVERFQGDTFIPLEIQPMPYRYHTPDLAVILGLCEWTELTSRIVKRPKGHFDRRFYHNKPEMVRAGKQAQYLANLPRIRVYPFSADYAYTVLPLTGSSEYLSSEWERTANLTWVQKRTYQKRTFPVRIPLEKRFDEDTDGNPVRILSEWETVRQQDVKPTRPRRHTTQECKVWNTTRNSKWARKFWAIRSADMRPSAQGEIKSATPEWKAVWNEMSATEPNTEEASMALTEWRSSLWRSSRDTAGLKP
jgi:hypothetical protein